MEYSTGSDAVPARQRRHEKSPRKKEQGTPGGTGNEQNRDTRHPRSRGNHSRNRKQEANGTSSPIAIIVKEETDGGVVASTIKLDKSQVDRRKTGQNRPGYQNTPGQKNVKRIPRTAPRPRSYSSDVMLPSSEKRSEGASNQAAYSSKEIKVTSGLTTPNAKKPTNDKFAWSAFQNSPDPKCLPIPSFYKANPVNRHKSRSQSTNSTGRDLLSAAQLLPKTPDAKLSKGYLNSAISEPRSVVPGKVENEVESLVNIEASEQLKRILGLSLGGNVNASS